MPRTARYYTLGPLAGRVRELWVVCHGFGQLAGRFLRHFEVLDDGARLIAAPEALSRFYFEATRDGRHRDSVGATWMTREDRDAEIADYVGYLDRLVAHLLARLEAPASRLCALGFSQGGAAAARWIGRGTTRADELVLWGLLLPADIHIAELAQRVGRLSLVAGREDPLVSDGRLEQQASEFERAGGRSRVVRYEGGHGLDPATLRALADSAGS